MQKFGASRIFPMVGPPLSNAVVVTDDTGTILSVDDASVHDPAGVSFIEGAIVPGFINAHCHLELSFMKGHIPEHTGLIEFVKQVVAIRDQFSPEEQQEAIAAAETEMYRHGIVAVGDISNDPRSFFRKQMNLLRYHTFVEVFDLGPQGTAQALSSGEKTLGQIPPIAGHSATMTPHAPYSCTPDLIRTVAAANQRQGLLSIHLQEHPEENRLFETGDGAWRSLFADWQLDDSWLAPTGMSSLQSLLPHLLPENRVLFIHNTFTATDDIIAATNYLQEVHFGFCPRANLYIENRLPDYRLFREAGVNCVIGTDSLASNHSLSIWEEIKVLHQHGATNSFEELLRWGTINGARCLGFDDTMGSIQAGKQPGLVALHNWHENDPFAASVTLERLI